jgi:hypothetical protein
MERKKMIEWLVRAKYGGRFSCQSHLLLYRSAETLRYHSPSGGGGGGLTPFPPLGNNSHWSCQHLPFLYSWMVQPAAYSPQSYLKMYSSIKYCFLSFLVSTKKYIGRIYSILYVRKIWFFRVYMGLQGLLNKMDLVLTSFLFKRKPMLYV